MDDKGIIIVYLLILIIKVVSCEDEHMKELVDDL